MCEAEEEARELRDEIEELKEELSWYKVRTNRDTKEQFISVPYLDVLRLEHPYVCFNKYSGCVCIKRFADSAYMGD